MKCLIPIGNWATLLVIILTAWRDIMSIKQKYSYIPGDNGGGADPDNKN